MNESIRTINENAWLLASIVLTYRFVIAGIAWHWLLPRGELNDSDRTLTIASQCAQLLLLGTLSALLLDWVLFETGAGGIRTSLMASTLLILTGVLIGLIRKHPWRKTLMSGVICSALLPVLIAAIMHLPNQGEWVLGGWDPGVYINQGVYVARTGTFHPQPDPGLATLQDNELTLFTRGDEQYQECFPGIPIDQNTRAIRNYFFRLTPTCIATLSQAGGLRLATRVNLLFGALAALMFLAALRNLSNNSLTAVFSTILLVSHPLWIYHMHLPTSEVLQCFLVSCAAYLIPWRGRRMTPLVLALINFAAILNRIDFMPFAAILMAGIALIDLNRPDRRRITIEHSAIAAAILLGTLFDISVTSITTYRLSDIIPKLITVAVISAVLTLAIDLTGLFLHRKQISVRLPRRTWVAIRMAVAILLTMLTASWIKPVGVITDIGWCLRGLMPYLGPYLTAIAAVSGLWLFRKGGAPPALILYAGFLATITVLTLGTGFIADIYPWATRRYLTFTLPLLALLTGHALSRLYHLGSCRHTAWRYAAYLALALILGANAKRSWHAWNRTELNGVSALLNEIAAEIASNDIVIVDSPKFATPLNHIYGKRVLNGKRIWASSDVSKKKAQMATLRRLSAEGHRIRFLTTTDKRLDIYECDFAAVQRDWETDMPMLVANIIHSKRASDFEMSEPLRSFALYTVYP